MPYFFILPAYILLLIILIAGAIACRFFPRLRSTTNYLLAGAVGTLVGFVVLNLITFLMGMMPVWLAQTITFPDWLQQPSKIFVAGVLLIGPFIASGVGILVGFAGGFYLARKKSRRAMLQS